MSIKDEIASIKEQIRRLKKELRELEACDDGEQLREDNEND